LSEIIFHMFPDKIEIKGNQDTPTVIFDKDQLWFEISGRSFPADADGFFQPLIKWLDDYKKSGPKEMTVLNVKMDYFNTASAKMILDMFFKLEDFKDENLPVMIKWHYLEEDDDMLEAGEEFKEIVELDFEFVEISE
jgi:hypothetical protein